MIAPIVLAVWEILMMGARPELLLAWVLAAAVMLTRYPARSRPGRWAWYGTVWVYLSRIPEYANGLPAGDGALAGAVWAGAILAIPLLLLMTPWVGRYPRLAEIAGQTRKRIQRR